MGATDISEVAEIQALLDDLDPQSHTLFKEAADGRDAQEFLSSPVGRYMLGAAQLEYREAMRRLLVTPWWRRRRIVELQNRAWRAEKFMGYLAEMVMAGVMAEKSLQERDDE